MLFSVMGGSSVIIHIPNYKSGYRIVSLAKDEKTRDVLIEENLSCIFVKENTATFYPELIAILLDEETAAKLSSCCNFDVFEINGNGGAYLYYNSASKDNAIIITNKCNSNCIMCPSSETSRKTGTTGEIENLLALVKHFPVTAIHLTITGGEPFLIGEDIFVLFRAIREKFYRTEFLLLTNGRAFAIKYFSELLAESLPKQTIIAIPIHGYDPESHDSVTMSPGSFVQTIAGIKNVLSQGLKLEIRIVVSQMTSEWLTKIASYLLNALSPTYCVKIIGLEMLGSASVNREKVWIPYRTAFTKAEEAIKQFTSQGIDVSLYNFPLCAVNQAYWHICEKSITDYKVRFAESCGNCTVRDACGGIFAGTYRMAKDDVTPIVGDVLC